MKTFTTTMALMAIFASPVFGQTNMIDESGYSDTAFTPPEAGKWYRLITRYDGDDSRKGACIQYFPTGKDPENSLYAAQPVDLFEPAYDYQLWQFEEDPDNPGRYAMICKAAPDGYLRTLPEIDGTPVSELSQLGKDCRWIYVPATGDDISDKYGFRFMTEDGMAGADELGNSYSGISTDELINIADGDLKRSVYMNTGGARVGFAINVWNHDYDDGANEYLFTLKNETQVPTAIGKPTDDVIPSEQVIYNLQGVRVSNPGNGIYIVNGQKRLIVK